jgi:voltage-gated potassium channel
VALRERVVESAEVGKPLSAIATGLGVRIYRDGDLHGFWEAEAAALRAGDLIVEIVPNG